MKRKKTLQMKQPKDERPLTLAEAQERIDQISTRRAQLIAGRIELSSRLETVEQEIGRKYLDGDRSGLQEAGLISAELRAIEAALALLTEDQKAATIDLDSARARDLRERVRQKRTELERLNRETQALLTKLGELEDAVFDQAILSSQPLRLSGAWLNPGTLKEPEDWLALTELIPNIPSQRPMAVPRSRRLRKEIEELQLQASEIEATLPKELSTEAA